MPTTVDAIVMEAQTYVEGTNQTHLMLPKGTRLVKVDPSGEAQYLQLKNSALQLCQEIAEAPLTDVLERKQIEMMLGKVQNIRRAVEAERKKKAAPVDELKSYLQDIYKKSILDPLDTAKKDANARLDEFNNKMLAEQAEQKRKEEEARKAAQPKDEEFFDPEEIPAAPKSNPVMADVKTSRTEAGNRFSKKTVEHEVINFDALPMEFRKLVVDEDKLKAAVNNVAEGIDSPVTSEELIKGVKVKVFWKGQLRG